MVGFHPLCPRTTENHRMMGIFNIFSGNAHNSGSPLIFQEETTMNKAELISVFAEKNGVTKKDAEQAVESVLSIITDTLAAGEKVQLVGFGSFETKIRSEHVGRNPSTKEPMTIPATRVATFKAGKVLKDAVAE